VSSAIGVISGFHAVIGGLARQPHWFLNDADAKRYGQAMANAARHFPLRATQKAIDVAMLIITAFAIDAPRIALSIQIAKQRNSGVPRAGAQVFQFINPNASASPPPREAAAAGASADQSPAVDADAPPHEDEMMGP
jgi:hypothetical protein